MSRQRVPTRDLTPGEREYVKAARKLDVKWNAIARTLGVSVDGLRRQADPAFKEARNVYNRAYQKRHSYVRRASPKREDDYVTDKPWRPGKPGTLPRDFSHAPPLPNAGPKPLPPRQPVHTDLTAALMGDPLPGRSAFDRKEKRP